jgi:hypothetical protein
MTKNIMHDWTLVSILYEWKPARVTISFRSETMELTSVVADGVTALNIPQTREWGPSVSVNKILGPTDFAKGGRKLEIEMQSGDVIEIVAGTYVFPPQIHR